MKAYNDTYNDVKELLNFYNYDVKDILDALPFHDRTPFLANAFALIRKEDQTEVNANSFIESFNHNLPYIIKIFCEGAHSYYGLSSLFSDMSHEQYGFMNIPEQPPTATPKDPIEFLLQYYNHKTKDHNIVGALENLAPEDRAPFIENLFDAASKQKIIDFDNLTYTLNHQLPHIVHMLQEKGRLKEDLGFIARTMHRFDMVYTP